MTILTASTDEQYASEDAAGGIFTNLVVDALAGAAANLVGDITPGSVYAHVDQSLGPWEQRPVPGELSGPRRRAAYVACGDGQ